MGSIFWKGKQIWGPEGIVNMTLSLWLITNELWIRRSCAPPRNLNTVIKLKWASRFTAEDRTWYLLYRRLSWSQIWFGRRWGLSFLPSLSVLTLNYVCMYFADYYQKTVSKESRIRQNLTICLVPYIRQDQVDNLGTARQKREGETATSDSLDRLATCNTTTNTSFFDILSLTLRHQKLLCCALLLENSYEKYRRYVVITR